MKFKCHNCHLVVEEKPCPNCGDIFLEPMCALDNCNCHHELSVGIKYCPDCGKPVCPVDGCLSHDVIQISRVTGYLSEVSGWNRSKQQELKDRQHYDV